MKEAVVTEDTG